MFISSGRSLSSCTNIKKIFEDNLEIRHQMFELNDEMKKYMNDFYVHLLLLMYLVDELVINYSKLIIVQLGDPKSSLLKVVGTTADETTKYIMASLID